MSDTRNTKLIVTTQKGTRILVDATIQFKNGRIFFLKSPFALKDEIKAMRGSKWHGHDEEDGRKIWSVEDCQRNRFQLAFLEGEDTYAWFDRDVIRHDYSDVRHRDKPDYRVMPHQADLADCGLMYHYQLFAAEMGTGKTLAAQLILQRSGVMSWLWVGPKSSIPNIKREFKLWGFDFSKINVEFVTYEELTSRMQKWKAGFEVPQGVIFDESSRLKGETSNRSGAAQMLADLIREKYGFDGYVIEMSGTPSPKSPLDWWRQCEIAWPGYIREGSRKALEQRMAFVVMKELAEGKFASNTGWKDDERKCKKCGKYPNDTNHNSLVCENLDDFHTYEPSFNEVAYMYERLKGLVQIKTKKDCLTLPDKRYRKIFCKPSPSTLRVAKALTETAETTIQGLTLLRELSDGFQYRDVDDGTKPCDLCETGHITEWFDPHDEDRCFRAIDMLDERLTSQLTARQVLCPKCDGTCSISKTTRIAKQIVCPKETALVQLLDECEETGRIVIFAGFTGSVDRVVDICHQQKWSVVRCDGRGFEVTEPYDKEKVKVICTGGEAALDYWADLMRNPRVAFVAHPESGGMSLTLVEARMAVYWSNSFKPEYRIQSEDRIHRKGMDENLGCEIVDLIHLPTDERVLEVIRDNRRLELMTMGEFATSFDNTDNYDLAA